MTSYFVAGIYAWDKVVRGAEIRQRDTGAVRAHYSQGKLFPGSAIPRVPRRTGGGGRGGGEGEGGPRWVSEASPSLDHRCGRNNFEGKYWLGKWMLHGWKENSMLTHYLAAFTHLTIIVSDIERDICENNLRFFISLLYLAPPLRVTPFEF